MKRSLCLVSGLLILAGCARPEAEVAGSPAAERAATEAEFVQARLARQPVVEPDAPSAANPFEPAAEPGTEPTDESASEPAAEPVAEPVSAPTPAAEPTEPAEPAAERAEPAAEPAPVKPQAKPQPTPPATPPAAKPPAKPKPASPAATTVKPAAKPATPSRQSWQQPPSQQQGTVVLAKLETVSAVPDPSSVPYRECLTFLKYRVVKVESGSYSGDSLLAVHWGMKDGRRAAAAGYRAGQQQRLTIEPLAKHPELSRVMQADDTGEYELTPYWVTRVD